MKKEEVAEILCEAIISCNCMKDPSIFLNESVASSSSSTSRKKREVSNHQKGRTREKVKVVESIIVESVQQNIRKMRNGYSATSVIYGSIEYVPI